MKPASECVRAWRESRQWRQVDLAERCGWRQYRVSRVETGDTALDIEDIRKLARIFGTTVEGFFRPDVKNRRTRSRSRAAS